ncbi:MAG: putative lipid II flippase FtsW [Verrucomicrobia bacterium]|nr:putative lipid II flippase FtsW [Verrucomicrobiota bacterium]
MWKTTSLLTGCVLILVTLGVVMLASTSSVHGASAHGDSLYFVKRQCVWLVVAILASFVAIRLDYHYWRDLAIPLAVFTLALLVMAVLPGVGISIKGSSRWLRFGPVRFQPSELAKLSSVVLLAWWMAKNQRHAEKLTNGLLLPLAGLGLFLGLIFVEPDFGTTLLIGVVGMLIMLIGGTRISYLVIAGALGLTGFTLAIMQNAERMRRIIAFLNPEKYAKDEAFQLLNAIYAFVIGGGRGVGLGQSLQKRFYLPEAHTDFIFAIIGEELGITASMGVIVLFLLIFLAGMHIALKAPDIFGRLLGFGITVLIALQAVINIGVVTGCLPTKGLPLPFISFGGSSLVMSCVMVGILINVARQSSGDLIDDDNRTIKDRARRI